MSSTSYSNARVFDIRLNCTVQTVQLIINLNFIKCVVPNQSSFQSLWHKHISIKHVGILGLNTYFFIDKIMDLYSGYIKIKNMLKAT